MHSRNALHHLPDFWKAVALDRVAQLLKPGGALILQDIVYSFDPAEAASVIERGSTRRLPIRREAGLPRNWPSTSGEHSTFTWLLEQILDRAGFDMTDRTYSENQVFASYVCRLRQ